MRVSRPRKRPHEVRLALGNVGFSFQYRLGASLHVIAREGVPKRRFGPVFFAMFLFQTWLNNPVSIASRFERRILLPAATSHIHSALHSNQTFDGGPDCCPFACVAFSNGDRSWAHLKMLSIASSWLSSDIA